MSSTEALQRFREELENPLSTPAWSVLLLYRAVDAFLKMGQYDTCDELLATLDLCKISMELQVGALRILYSSRKRLKNWYDFRDRVRDHLKKQGEDTDLLLQGLFEPCLSK